MPSPKPPACSKAILTPLGQWHAARLKLLARLGDKMTDYHCTHYDGYRYCKAQATHRLLVNGLPAQGGGYVCEEHGRVVVEEYAPHGGLLGTWTMEPLEAQP